MIEPAVVIQSIVAAIIPTILYIAIIYWFDRYEKEPWWLLTAAFLWGAIPSIIVAFIFNTVLSIPFYALAGDSVGNALAASLIAPPVEETVKGIALLGILFIWRDEIDSILDGIIYGAMVGMGFAVVENVFYFLTVYAESGVEAWQLNIFVRSILFGLNHALFSAMTGLGIAIARMSPNTAVRILAPVGGWMTAMFLHFVHNASVSFGPLLCLLTLFFDWGGLLLILCIIIWALVQERDWIRTYLADEVTLGTLSPQHYELACSGRRRNSYTLSLLFSNGPGQWRRTRRFFQRCSELAYKKHHVTLFQDARSQQQIEQIRAEIVVLGETVARE